MTTSTPPFPETCVAIDLETTGLRSESDEIIEIGAVLYRGTEVLGTYHQMVDPGRQIPTFISLLTGIQQEEVDGAPSFKEIAPALTEFIGDHAIVGQSVSFDLAFLAAQDIRPTGPVYDTRDLSRLVRPDATDHGLAALATTFDVVNESPHRALADAETTMKVFQALWQRLYALEPETLAMARSLALRGTEDWGLGRLIQEAARLRDVAPGTSADVIRALLKRIGPPATPAAPLRPRLMREAAEPDAIGALFSEDGPAAHALETYEPRPQQATMAARILQAFDQGETLLIEAPPGTGKSLAYLVPALAFAHANQAPVVVATSTRGLQEQLATKDLPTAFQILGLDTSEVPVAVLKGRGNYLCLSRLIAALDRTDLPVGDIPFFIRLLVWLETTQRGDIGELSLGEQENARWSALSASAGDDHASCIFQREGTCFLARSRREAQAAHIVITNHALLLADSAREGGVLSHVKHMVLDEAHHLENEATEQYRRNVTQREIDDLLETLGAGTGRPRLVPTAVAQAAATGATARSQEIDRLGETTAQAAETASQRSRNFFPLLANLASRQRTNSSDNESRLRLTPIVREQKEWHDANTAWEEINTSFGELARSLGQLRDAVVDVTEASILYALDEQLWRLNDARNRMELVMSETSSDDVAWLGKSSEGRGSGIGLHWAPLSVTNLLESGLFHDRESVVLTSATLATEGSFSYIKRRLGLESAGELSLDSPFDMHTAAAIFTPSDIPAPNANGYARAVEQIIAQVTEVADGGVLVLFTSHSALRQAYSHVKSILQPRGITVMAQGIDGPPARLAEMMRREPRSVILGAATFWEGVDLSGNALRVLIIPRLPFSVPSDPIVAARSETYDEPFAEYTLPVSLLRFRQGLGRLIRSGQDQGAIILLDSRVLTRGYGASYLEALPSETFSTPTLADLPQKVREWLDGA